jgi:prepilin-type N-terminal cleavage/methylation domain-containing protein
MMRREQNSVLGHCPFSPRTRGESVGVRGGSAPCGRPRILQAPKSPSPQPLSPANYSPGTRLLLQAGERGKKSPGFSDIAQPRRRGLTLLEVVIALAIFLIALVPVWRLVSLGGERALDVAHQAQASMLCQAKLDSVKVGAESLNASGTVDIGNLSADTGQPWNYTIESTPADVSNLYTVTVTVKVDRKDGKTIQASLTQLVLDPAVRGSTISATTTSSSSSSSTTTSGGM